MGSFSRVGYINFVCLRQPWVSVKTSVATLQVFLVVIFPMFLTYTVYDVLKAISPSGLNIKAVENDFSWNQRCAVLLSFILLEIWSLALLLEGSHIVKEILHINKALITPCFGKSYCERCSVFYAPSLNHFSLSVRMMEGVHKSCFMKPLKCKKSEANSGCVVLHHQR